jgi:hypothetical protein
MSMNKIIARKYIHKKKSISGIFQKEGHIAYIATWKI